MTHILCVCKKVSTGKDFVITYNLHKKVLQTISVKNTFRLYQYPHFKIII